MSTKRDPLLSDEWIRQEREDGAIKTQLYDGFALDTWKGGFQIAMNIVKAKIASGELMVVKSVTYGDGAGLARNCSGCSHLSTLNESKYFNFCPGCGAKIIKP